ncbi:DUF4129 domain-containing protein [Natrinema gari]|uniref:Protein-glutamine gamma-glutamyltransferase-like C-terminal domain-containing protein n=1 Tax=Natrinema gari JCM 14663 TaxID=1230459 RepID=L9Z317_9EURY|nr:DUF4129 domain-containing protein [Natrinema gari]ELY80087.1 hypothetical protein C486_10245 [Natrinema gari JCM 14663]
MSDDATPDDADDAASGGADYRQGSLVALAALALVLTAALAPGLTGGESDSTPGADVDWDGIVPDIDFNPDADTDIDGTDGGGNADGEPGDGPDGGFDWQRLLEWLNLDRNDDVEPPTETDGKPQCVIMLDREPVPGSRLTATIRYEGEPLTETPVWFDERRVGETDDAGRVTGKVPYVKELVIRVGTAADTTCRAGTSTSLPSSATTGSAGYHSDDARQSSTDVQESGGPKPEVGAVPSVRRDVPAAATASTPSVAPPTSSTPVLASSAAPAASVRDGSSGNATGSYAVDGEVAIDVDGEPYPGETITINAAVADVPMREATVSVDGTAVGETDGSGRAAVRVPDDGTDTFEIEVARGDFAGTTTVDVLSLEAAFAPAGIAPIPGSPGAVEATINGEPVAGATVTVDGETVGTTDADGRLATGVPLDPTATVTVSTERQTASVSLVGAYGRPALVLAGIIAGLIVLSYRYAGRRGPMAVLGGTAGLAAVLVAEAFYGIWAGIAILGGGCLLGLGVGLSRSGRGVPSRSVRNRPSPRDWLDRLLARLVALGVGLVDRLEVLLEWLHALAGAVHEWVRSLPRSGRGLWARFAAWLGTVPGRVRTGLKAALATVRTLPLRAIAAGVGAGPLIAGGYVVDGVRGAVLVTAALAAIGVMAVRAGGEAPQTDARDRDAEPAAETAATADTNHAAAETRSFRDLWRAFARQVAPGRWRTRTPGEIERRALSKGYPRTPVRELTTLFREVEYGGRPRSASRRERAAEAYDAVERARAAETEATTAEAAAERDADGTRSASPTDPSRESEPETEGEP